MQKSKTATETLDTLTNAEKNGHNSQLITHTQLDYTPFTITGSEEQGYFLRIGDYRLTEYFKTHDEVMNNLDEYHWITTANLISAILDAWHKNNK